MSLLLVWLCLVVGLLSSLIAALQMGWQTHAKRTKHDAAYSANGRQHGFGARLNSCGNSGRNRLVRASARGLPLRVVLRVRAGVRAPQTQHQQRGGTMRAQRKFRAAILGIAALLLGGAGQARAALIPLPTTLDQLLPPGNFAVVGPVPYTFSNFSYSTDPAGSPPSTANITVREFHAGAENGITFSGGFRALPGTTVDYAFSYVVTAPVGANFIDATLTGALGNNGGTGSVSVVQLLTFPNGSALPQEISLPGSAASSITFAGVSSILVQEDIFINGGSLGASVSSLNQGFSSSAAPAPPPAVPEPSSLALLALGGAALTGWRRWRKRATA
jgi:hypothetical protein